MVAGPAPLRADTWLVTAPHRVLTGDWRDPDWTPWGPHHARRVGENRTACGTVSIGWPSFWELRFDPRDGDSCPACAAAVAGPGAEAEPGQRPVASST